MIVAPKAGGAPLKCALKIALENLIQRLLESQLTFQCVPRIYQFLQPLLQQSWTQLTEHDSLLFSYYWLEFIFTVQPFESEVFPRCLWCLSSFVKENATSSCRAGGSFQNLPGCKEWCCQTDWSFSNSFCSTFVIQMLEITWKRKGTDLESQNTKHDKES